MRTLWPGFLTRSRKIETRRLVRLSIHVRSSVVSLVDIAAWLSIPKLYIAWSSYFGGNNRRKSETRRSFVCTQSGLWCYHSEVSPTHHFVSIILTFIRSTCTSLRLHVCLHVNLLVITVSSLRLPEILSFKYARVILLILTGFILA